MRLIFVDCEATGTCPADGALTEFGAVAYPSREIFHGVVWHTMPSKNNPAIPVLVNPSSPMAETFLEFEKWLKEVCGNERPVMVSDNPAYDWMWIADGFATIGRNPLGHCIGGDSRVICPDKTMLIREMVTQHHPGPVLSVGPDGELGFKKVIGWYCNLRMGRPMVRIHFSPLRLGGSFMTIDHEILTSEGWRDAGNIEDGDFICTGELEPNNNMRELIDGTLLGDASITKEGVFAFSQTCKEYSFLKQKSLFLLGAQGREEIKTNTPYNCAPAWKVWFPNRLWTKYERIRWYGSGKKVPPQDLRLSDLSLAAWFMDDGYGQPPKHQYHSWVGTLATQAFDEKSRQFLVQKLSTRGIEAHNSSRKGNLYITSDGFRALVNLIGRYVPSTMRYKIPSDAPPFDPESWNLGGLVMGIKPAIVEKMEFPRRNRYNKVYCLEIEDWGNFVLWNGGVAKNSARRIGDFYAGLVGDFNRANDWKRLRVTRHDHNPVNDALGNLEAFDRMLHGER